MSLNKDFALLLSILLCFCSLLLASCDLLGGSAVPLVKVPADKQIYTIPEVGITDFETLDPALARDTASTNAIQMLFTGLVEFNDKLEIVPQLAQSWQQGDDGVTWTFHLKPHLTFNDGASLTSTDVAYSIDRALQPALQSTTAPLYLSLIKDSDQLLAGHISTLIGHSLLTPDATTLVITTNKKAAYFPAMLTMPCSYVVEKSLITRYGAKFTDHLNEGGGAGPFKVAQYVHGQQIRFVPNTHYYDKQPQLQSVKMVFFHSTDEAYRAYQTNQVDMTGVPLSTLANDSKRKDFHQVPQSWTNYYTMNYLVKPFDNVKIRQAFALAINKLDIAKNVWKDTVIPTNHIIPQGLPAYNANLKGPDGITNVTGNAQLAQTLLQQGIHEEGWSSVVQMPKITLTYATGVPGFDQEVQALIQTWRNVLQVTVVSNPVDYNTLLDKVTAATFNAQGLQFWGLSWVGEYPDPQDWLSLQFARGVPNNNMNYGQNTSTTLAQQQSVQQLLESADANFNAPARLKSYQQAEQQLVNDVAWLPIEQVTSTFLRSPNIVGIVDNGQSIIPPDDWASIYRVQ
jgi:peptide/nickel transport system substrate-binding protein/oligopeptide transport system substrate-binding protein